MKPVIILVSMMLAAPIVFADSFTVTRDGREYLCSPTTPTVPGGAVECVNKAYAGPFSRDEAMRLCQGARSIAPADCAIKGYAGSLNREQAITLCIGARSTAPVDCQEKAYRGPFSVSESLELCQGDSSVATAECAIKAYNGPYSRAEAIRLCKSNPQLLLRAMKLMEHSKEVQQQVREMKMVNPTLTE